MLVRSSPSLCFAWLLLGIVSCGTTGAAGPLKNGGDGGTGPDAEGPTLTCPSAIEVPPRSSAERDAAFEALTKNNWSDSGCINTGAMLPPTCTRLELRKDGSYALTSISDYPERDDAGRWNFALTSATSGTICLDGAKATAIRHGALENQPSAVYFSLSPSGLALGGYGFSAAMPSSSSGSAADLDPITLPAGYIRLTGEGWRNASKFGLGMELETVTFERSGRFSASYGSGACTHGGHFSWDRGMLTPNSDANQCGPGGKMAIIGGSNEEPVFLDDLLVLYAYSLRPASSTSTRRVFIFDPYVDSLRVRWEFDGTLGASVATPIAMTFENVEKIPRRLLKLEVSMQKLLPAADGNGYTIDGDKAILVTRDYTGVTLAPGDKHADSFDLVPSLSGPYIELEFTVDYEDERQPFHGSRPYFVSIP